MNIIETVTLSSILFVVLFFSINIYFWVANKYNIVDNPNHRSSHTKVTIRGGGIIFPLSILFYEIINQFQDVYFFTGLFLLSLVSFWDDVQNISTRIRFGFQLVATLLLLFSLEINNYWLLLILFPIIIGFINGYNFMDGINGITGLYSLVILVSLCFVNISLYYFIDLQFLTFLIVPTLVFLFYNFRKKAKCFAGDIGSISIAFIIAYLLLILIINTGNIAYLLFISIYGIDILGTILQRLWLRQNILKPHRMHFYQILANEIGWSHLSVSVLYASLQLFINILVFYMIDLPVWQQFQLGCYVFIPLVCTYVFLKHKHKPVVIG